MLAAADATALSTALQDLDRAVSLAQDAASKADPWWNVLPWATDVSKAADSAQAEATSLAQLRDALKDQAAALATSSTMVDHATAQGVINMAQSAAKRWTAVTDLAEAVQERPAEVAQAATGAVVATAGAVAKGVAATASALPLIVGGVLLVVVVAWLWPMFARGKA